MKLKGNIKESVFKDDELTRHAFISHMSAYINSLLNKPTSAQPDDHLKSFGIDGKKALEIVLDKNKPYGPLVMRSEKIKTDDDNKDRFYIKYTFLNNENNFYDKMKALYNKYVENNINESVIKEEGEGGFSGGATAGSESMGAYDAPFTKKPIKRKTIYITEEQLNYIREAVQMDTMHGDFGYDAPGLEISENDPTMNHQNMVKKSRKINEASLSNVNGTVTWNIYDVVSEDEMDILVETGIVPEELYGDFIINVNYDAFDDNEGNKSIGGDDYNAAISYINQIKDNTLKQAVMDSLENTVNIESSNLDNVSVNDYDKDDIYQDYYDFKNDK